MSLFPSILPGFADALATIAGLGLTFLVHATVLLLAVWAIERLGWLKEPAWAEWAWRVALFGAFVSVAVEAVPRGAPETTAMQRLAAIAPVQAPEAAMHATATDQPALPALANVEAPQPPTAVRTATAPRRSPCACRMACCCACSCCGPSAARSWHCACCDNRAACCTCASACCAKVKRLPHPCATRWMRWCARWACAGR